MKVNISKMKESDIIEVEFEKIYDIPSEYCINLVNITFKGDIAYNNNIYTLSGDTVGDIEAECSSCLTSVKQSIDFEIVENFQKAEYAEEAEDLKILEGYEIDVDEQVYQNLIMNLPLKIVCKDDCKGLCTKCGVNLNTSTCDCKSKGEINPKFEKLLEFFDENNSNN